MKITDQEIRDTIFAEDGSIMAIRGADREPVLVTSMEKLRGPFHRLVEAKMEEYLSEDQKRPKTWTIYYPGAGMPRVREVAWEGQGFVVLAQPEYMNRKPEFVQVKHTYGRFTSYGEALRIETIGWRPNIKVTIADRALTEARKQETSDTIKALEEAVRGVG